MKFITIKDLKSRIKSSQLSQSLQVDKIFNPDNTILNDIEDTALSTVKAYLSAYYDTQLIFSQTGKDRNPLIINIIIDCMLYDLLVRLSTDDIPEIRETKYNNSMRLLKDISMRKVNLDLPQKNINYDTKVQILWDSTKKNSTDW